jgi:hypothetical protein
MKRGSFLTLIQAITAASVVAVIALAAPPARGDGGRYGYGVDVAMNGHRFFDFEENPTPGKEDVPPDGSPFVIQGYIYPAGTFDEHGDTSGVLADGSPEFPDKVIGTWTCRGWHLQDGDAVTGPVVATTQIFDFDLDEPGRHTIVTDGFELADFDVPHRRAVVGGTGAFESVTGQMVQTYVWEDPEFLNASGGFNTSFEFRLRRPWWLIPLFSHRYAR